MFNTSEGVMIRGPFGIKHYHKTEEKFKMGQEVWLNFDRRGKLIRVENVGEEPSVPELSPVEEEPHDVEYGDLYYVE